MKRCTLGIVALLALAVGCSSGDDPTEIMVTEATAEECPNGGVAITVNGETHIICHGEDGTPGESSTVSVEVLPEGHEDCPGGGYMVEIDGEEYPVCHGEAAEAAEVSIEPVEPGEECPFGGYEITVGDDVEYLCHGADGSSGIAGFAIEELEAGAECEEGGYVLVLLDEDGDPISEHPVCHGEQGPVGPAPAVEVEESTSCEHGGWTVTIGEGEEAESFDVCNGQDGFSPSVSIESLEEDDPRCAWGGYLIIITTVDEEGEELIEEIAICHGAGFEMEVDWCQLSAPASATVDEGEPLDVYALVYAEGVTGECTPTDCDRPEGFFGQAGVGPRDSMPHGNTDWDWSFEGEPNVHFDGGGSDVNDEFVATVAVDEQGEYDLAFRFSLNQGVSWVYCDLEGSDHDYDPFYAGKLTVEGEPEQTLAGWTFGPSGEETWSTTEGIDENSSQEMSLVGANFSAWVAGYDTSAPNANGWDDGIGTKYWLAELTTEGFEELRLTSLQNGSNTGPRDFMIQWSLDGSDWTDVVAVEVGNNWTTGAVDVPLPTDLNDQPTVHLRWVVDSTTAINEGDVSSAGTNRIDEIRVFGVAID